MLKDRRKAREGQGALEGRKGKVRVLPANLPRSPRRSREELLRSKRLEEALIKSEKKCQVLLDYVNKSASLIQDMEEERRQASKMEEMGKIMVPALLHDLGNLVGAIRSHAQFCIEDMDLDPSVASNLRMIFESSDKASALIIDFLKAARSATLDSLDLRSLDVNTLVTNVWKMVRPHAPRKMAFRAELEEDLPEITGDIEKLERLFLNLLTNAIQAAPDKGRVTVRSRYLPSEEMVEIDVMDNGPGIPEEAREKIFEPFFTTKKEGTGLGLSICRFIVQQHKGSIRVDLSEHQGTTFRVKLPTAVDRRLQRPASCFRDAGEDGMEFAYSESNRDCGTKIIEANSF